MLSLDDRPDHCVYVSGDTVWYEGMTEVARRFHVTVAVLFMGAARVREVGPAHLTLTAEEGVEVARAMPDAVDRAGPLRGLGAFLGRTRCDHAGVRCRRAEQSTLLARARAPGDGRYCPAACGSSLASVVSSEFADRCHEEASRTGARQ